MSTANEPRTRYVWYTDQAQNLELKHATPPPYTGRPRVKIPFLRSSFVLDKITTDNMFAIPVCDINAEQPVNGTVLALTIEEVTYKTLHGETETVVPNQGRIRLPKIKVESINIKINIQHPNGQADTDCLKAELITDDAEGMIWTERNKYTEEQITGFLTTFEQENNRLHTL